MYLYFCCGMNVIFKNLIEYSIKDDIIPNLNYSNFHSFTFGLKPKNIQSNIIAFY